MDIRTFCKVIVIFDWFSESLFFHLSFSVTSRIHKTFSVTLSRLVNIKIR